MLIGWSAGLVSAEIVALSTGRSRRSVWGAVMLGEGVRLWVDECGTRYVRAKSLKRATTTLKNWRFKTRFFASFLFAFEKK